jgi:hypothetical protein
MKKVRAQAFASVPRIRMVVVSQGSILRPATDQLIQRGEVYLESYFNGHLIKRFIAPGEVAEVGACCLVQCSIGHPGTGSSGGYTGR